MKTVIRNSYTPKIGDYCETIVVDKETNNAYIFDCDGVFTPVPQPVDVEKILEEAAAYTDEQVAPLAEKLDTIEEGAQVNVIEHVLENGTELTITNKTVNVTVPTKTSDLTNDGSDGTDTYVESATLDDYYTKSETDTQIGYETTAREIADAGLQEQIDAIVASSDVVDIVGTYAALQAYDTSKLHDNDIIKVLDDETRDDATTYYRWDADTSTWSYIGAEGPFYTKAESDAIFVPQTRTVNNKALSSDITLTAADVGALPDSTVIPTVNDATLTIQKNGTTVQTFTANQATNATANITVPTKTSDITNDSGFITEEDVYEEVCKSGKTITFQDTASSSLSSFQLLGETSQNGTPTPDAPVPVKVVTGENVVKISDGQGNEQSYPISLGSIELCKIGDYQDYIYKDGSDWKIHKEAGVLAVDTSTITSSGTAYSNIVYGQVLKNDDAKNKGTYSHYVGLCSHAIWSGNASNWNSADNAGKCYDAANGSRYWIGFASGTSLDDIKTALSGCKIVYPLATPTDTEITNETLITQLDNVASAPLYTGVNNITTVTPNEQGTLEICYVNTILPYATKDKPGIVQIGDGLSVDSNGVISSDGLTSVDWDDIDNKPTNVSYWTNDAGYITAAALPTVNNATLTIQKNGTDVASFTANSSTATTANITVPTDTSDLTNGAGFITTAALSNYYTKSETYTQNEVNSLINSLSIPTKTSDLVNDSGFLTSIPVASANDLGGVKIGTGLSIDADGVVSVTSAGAVAWADVTGKPTNVSYWTNDAGYITSASIPTNVSSFTNDAGYITSSDIPTDVSAFTNDAGYLTSSALSNYYTKSETYSQNEVNALINTIAIPTKTSDLTNDGDDGVHAFLATDDVATVAATGDYDDLINKPTIPTVVDMTGATSSTAGAHGYVPAPAAGDQDKVLRGDGTWATLPSPELVEMSYGESNAWAKFIAAYNANCIVYCRASSNANPATGAQTRKAFMAYVNNETNPTQVEFQYYRSVSSHSDSQQGDQVFVYLLKNDNSWSVTTRNTFTKIAAGTNMTSSYSSGTLTLNGKTIDSALDVSSTNPVQNSVVTAAINSKQDTLTAGTGIDITGTTLSVDTSVIAEVSDLPTKTSDLTNDGSDGTSTYVEADDLATVATTGDYEDLTNTPSIPDYQAGDHIDITNGTISAIDYVHSENPVSITTPGTTVSGSEITDGSIGFSKVDSTQFLKLQLTTTDPGEGAALAANTLLGVYQ